MKKAVLAFIIIFLSLVQASFLPFNLLFGLISLLAITSSSWEIFLWPFWAGFFLDLFAGNPLGFSSLGFLACSFLFFLYKQRFSFKSPVTVFLFVLLGGFVFSLLARRPFFYKEIFFWAASFALLRLFAPFFFEGLAREENGKLKL